MQNAADDICLLRLPDVRRKTGLSRSAIYRLVATGDFPKPVRPSKATTAWVSHDVDQWIGDRIRAARGDVV